ncbi:MAG: amidase [Myxococcota bacterium]
MSARDVLEAHIERIRRVNPVLNAMVRDRFEAAREEADAADASVRSGAGPLPWFYGVPCSIKEAFALSGMPQTGGLLVRKGHVAPRDATAVARIRGAGAIPMGVTNVSELCMWFESSNRVYGRTNNPYDPKRMVGGSSGGEGALIGAGASPFGLGSDIGGSIRMPAFFNGVFGHKPSSGLVPSTGQFPISHGDARKMLCSGPLARRAEDLFPLLRILAGPDGEDSACVEMDLLDPAEVDVRELVVLDVEDDGKHAVARSLVGVQRAAGEALAKAGATVQRAGFPGMARAIDLWSSRLQRAGGESFAALLGDGKADRSLRHFGRWMLGRSPHTLPALLLAHAETVTGALPGLAVRCARLEQELRDELTSALGERGVMLYPSFPRTATRHYMPLLRPFEFRYTAVFNVLGFPVTQVPMGLGEDGLPLGLQVAAAPGNDHLTIAVALELERVFGGWRPPSWE